MKRVLPLAPNAITVKTKSMETFMKWMMALALAVGPPAIWLAIGRFVRRARQISSQHFRTADSARET
jgi:hypothetical protein